MSQLAALIILAVALWFVAWWLLPIAFGVAALVVAASVRVNPQEDE